MRRWFVLTAVGRDRPGLVAELARLIYDSDANLEDSRMTILGTEFAIILLCSSDDEDAGERIALGAKHLEREHGLMILQHGVAASERPPVPAPGHQLYRVRAAGEDKAGIVASICGVLAEHGVNIADLRTDSRPGPGGSPHYEMSISVELPETTSPARLREALDAEGDRLIVDVSLTPE